MNLRLSGRLQQRWPGSPVITRITHDVRTLPKLGPCVVSICEGSYDAFLTDGKLRTSPADDEDSPGLSQFKLPAEVGYLKQGDILRVNPAAGEVRVIYRRGSPNNFLFITERCNSRCVMCSQPPREVNDSYHLDDLLTAIPLMDSNETPELCITGGEPMLAGERVFEIVRAVRDYLPHTALHVLSNGRLFSNLELAKGLAATRHSDLMVGVPLYSDVASLHDFVVQAAGAYDESLRGLLNLRRVGIRIELRVVIHKQTVRRISKLARFIVRNLPFVSQTVFMGLEITGYTRSNLEALWIDPAEYQSELREAVEELASAKQRVLIYNHPLCLLPRDLWLFARQSISDWKNIYLPACEPCAMRTRCGGFFASATARHSAYLNPLVE